MEGIYIYFALILLSFIFGVIAYSKSSKKLKTIQLILTIMSAIAFFIFYINIDDSSVSGYYVYRINGASV